MIISILLLTVSDCDEDDMLTVEDSAGELRCLIVFPSSRESRRDTWWQALNHCREEGWELYVPHSTAEQERLELELRSGESYWIGVTRNQWYWAEQNSEAYGGYYLCYVL